MGQSLMKEWSTELNMEHQEEKPSQSEEWSSENERKVLESDSSSKCESKCRVDPASIGRVERTSFKMNVLVRHAVKVHPLMEEDFHTKQLTVHAHEEVINNKEGPRAKVGKVDDSNTFNIEDEVDDSEDEDGFEVRVARWL